MPRIVSIYLPHWPIERRRRRSRSSAPRLNQPPKPPASTATKRRPTTPNAAPPAVVLTHTHGGRQVVAAATPRALRAGIQPGLSLAHARALLPPEALDVQAHHPQRDARALSRLARWLMRFSPVVQADPPEGVLLDIAGCAHLFGGEASLLLTMRRALMKLGFTARLAAAPTIGAAWALSRYAERQVISVEPTQLRQALAPLPLAALRLDAKIITSLSELGLTHVADVLSLPRSTLPARFGSELLLRLDQALGQAVELIEPLAPRAPLEHTITFDGPATQLEAVQAAARELLHRLRASLQEREAGARTLALTIERALLEPIVIPLSVSRPTRDPKHLWSLLAPHLEAIHLGHGVDAVTLAVVDSARVRHRQLNVSAGAVDNDVTNDETLGQLLDTLISMLGRTRVMRLAARETHVPEDRFRLLPVSETPPADVAGFAGQFVQRPSYLLDEPLSMRVATDATGQPQRLILPEMPHPLRVIACVGPERLAQRWWEGPLPEMGVNQQADSEEADAADEIVLASAAAAHRLYYRLRVDTGLLLWVYRDARGDDWRLHGIWS
jgi:protein ImuB